MNKFILIIISVLFTSLNVCSQEFINTIDSIYGLNPTLYNGQINAYNLGNNVIGNPYLYENFSQGTVTIQDKTYSNLSLNYDIFNQVILLKYINPYGTPQIITLSNAWLKHFSILTDSFQLIDNHLIEKEIYQKAGNDSIRILFSWKKDLKLSTSDAQKYTFTKAEKKMFLYINKSYHKFSNNRNFIKLFDKPKQTLIKKYLKHHKINVKKSSNEFILDLLIYCNKLEN